MSCLAVPIVGIGASAGGLEAVGAVLEGLPARIGAAVIFVSHLERNHESVLAGILGHKSTMPVLAAEDGIVPLADHIYVIVPNMTLTLRDGRLHLEPRAAGPQPQMPVNALFQSLAQECGASAIGIVMSGAESDGAAGIRAIKQAGGITMVQDPLTAVVPGMPNRAIDTGCADLVLPPARIATELVRLLALPFLSAESIALSVADSGTPAQEEPEPGLQRLFRRLRAAHGVDFSRYKLSTLRRRLARRMALQRIDDLEGYVRLLEGDATETAALYQDFLIRVTGFFRDPEVYKTLAAEIFPALCRDRSEKDPIRIWVPACATGEEVYSIAIALLEFLGEQGSSAELQVFGTDVNEASIDKARAGLFPESIEEDVSSERLKRFFVRGNAGYGIARQVRDLCIFARQDVTRDPPFSRLDLISCRNLLIYLGAAAQQRVMQTFHYSLRRNGYLLLGSSESVGPASELFELKDPAHRLYIPRPVGRRSGADLPLVPIAGNGGIRERQARPEDALPDADTALRQADRWFLSRYAPASILVDDGLEILQFRGDVGPYLSPASGPPSKNLTSVVRPDLLPVMTVALEEARGSGKVSRRAGLAVDGAGSVDLQVVPLPHDRSSPSYLFVFDRDPGQVGLHRTLQPDGAASLSDTDKDMRLARLEREAADLREFLQATIEQHEAAKEALRAAHEEVLSANEELQSTNEELETSKEELQSGNEELMTTNDELRDRNTRLDQLNAELEVARKVVERARVYADGIIDTLHDPLVVLDAQLRVLRANPAFYAAFGLPPGPTEGQLLQELCDGRWNVPVLREKLLRVLSSGEPLTNQEFSFDAAGQPHRLFCLGARLLPRLPERDALILMSAEDITERRAKAGQERERSRRKDEFLAMLAHELRNPLAPIVSAVQLLKRGTQDAPVLHEMILRQATRLIRLVDDLLDVARISRGLVELRRDPVDLVAVVRNTVEANQARLEQRGHMLALANSSTPVTVLGDAARLEQVVANLLENAIKYTNPGGRITLTLRESSGEALLSIADNGIGIREEALASVFELFSQVDSSLARSGGGLGLGLTVVRRIIELHGGRIEAHSEGLGKGSEFVVRIPLHRALPASNENARTQPVASTVQARRVLIVDDNVDAAETLSLLISGWGHETRTAHTARQALELAGQFCPQTALLDIGLPDMDGYALARRMRSEDGSGSLQLIAMTGYGRAEDRLAASQSGFDLHLVKPADLDELARVLGAAAPAMGQPAPDGGVRCSVSPA